MEDLMNDQMLDGNKKWLLRRSPVKSQSWSKCNLIGHRMCIIQLTIGAKKEKKDIINKTSNQSAYANRSAYKQL